MPLAGMRQNKAKKALSILNIRKRFRSRKGYGLCYQSCSKFPRTMFIFQPGTMKHASITHPDLHPDLSNMSPLFPFYIIWMLLTGHYPKRLGSAERKNDDFCLSSITSHLGNCRLVFTVPGCGLEKLQSSIHVASVQCPALIYVTVGGRAHLILLRTSDSCVSDPG